MQFDSMIQSIIDIDVDSILSSILLRYEPDHAQMIRHSVHSGPEVYMSHANPSAHNNSAQMDLLRENERLRKELEGYSEKAARLQKVRERRLLEYVPNGTLFPIYSALQKYSHPLAFFLFCCLTTCNLN